MADTLGMDPTRIERLRSPERLEYFHPDQIWELLKPAPGCTLIDIGAGVGFLTLSFAERFPQAKAYGCDILEGMVDLLREDAAERGLDNLVVLLMAPNGHCQTNLGRPAKGAGPRRSGRQLPPLGQGGGTVLSEDIAAV